MKNPSIISVAAIGNVADINTFSGTPYHFFHFAKQEKLCEIGWEMDLSKIGVHRKWWNLLQILQLRRYGGFQYSDYFENQILKQIPKEYLGTEVISFNQFFPSAKIIKNHGGKIYYYLDATFKQLLERYGVENIIGKRNIQKILEKEKRNFELADKVVAFQNWCKDSIIDDYEVDSKKVNVILPGANLIIPQNYRPVSREEGKIIGKDSPLVLGFIGKDWKRKGLPLIISLRKQLEGRGYKVIVRCIGNAPDELKNEKGVEFLGFIDKNRDIQAFCDFITSCDIGCLFSTAEFSSISVLEFIRLSVPVAGFIVDGMGDLYFEECSLRFKVTDSLEKIVDSFETVLKEPQKYNLLKQGAKNLSTHASWRRCIEEWEKILI